MTPVGQDKPAAARIPYLDEVVPASGGDARAIGRPGQGIHLICMTTKYQVIIALTLLKSIPDLYSPVPGSGGDARPIGRPGYRDYVNVEAFRIMAKKGTHIFVVGNVPN